MSVQRYDQYGAYMVERKDGQFVTYEDFESVLTTLRALVNTCKGCASFSNGVTDPTGTIDEGDVLGWAVVEDAQRVVDQYE